MTLMVISNQKKKSKQQQKKQTNRFSGILARNQFLLIFLSTALIEQTSLGDFYHTV